MSFHPISVSTKTWNEVAPGKYMDSTVTFGDPANYIQISGGKRNSKTGITTASTSRVMQKDVTVGADTVRRTLSVQCVVQVQDGFTTTEVDSTLLTLSDLFTVAFLERLLQGEQ
jgi:hypothetical protein